MGIDEFKVLEMSSVVSDLITLLQAHLPNFTGSEEFVKILEKKKNENQHTLSFCAFMTNICQSQFYFARENAQLGSSVIDIGVYKGGTLIFTLEAKLLPNPLGKK